MKLNSFLLVLQKFSVTFSDFGCTSASLPDKAAVTRLHTGGAIWQQKRGLTGGGFSPCGVMSISCGYSGQSCLHEVHPSMSCVHCGQSCLLEVCPSMSCGHSCQSCLLEVCPSTSCGHCWSVMSTCGVSLNVMWTLLVGHVYLWCVPQRHVDIAGQ